MSGVLSSLPYVLVLDSGLADEAWHERESSLSPSECESGEMCVMGWENMWMRWVKT